VNKLDAEARAERQGRTADLISRLDFLILDELGNLPFAIDLPPINRSI
jgi:DNA replication protein DnaC